MSDIRLQGDAVMVEGENMIVESKHLLVLSEAMMNDVVVGRLHGPGHADLQVHSGLAIIRPGGGKAHTALSQSAGDELVINAGGGYPGGVRIEGRVVGDVIVPNRIPMVLVMHATGMAPRTRGAASPRAGAIDTSAPPGPVLVEQLGDHAQLAGVLQEEQHARLVERDRLYETHIDLVALVFDLRDRVEELEGQLAALTSR